MDCVQNQFSAVSQLLRLCVQAPLPAWLALPCQRRTPKMDALVFSSKHIPRYDCIHNQNAEYHLYYASRYKAFTFLVCKRIVYATEFHSPRHNHRLHLYTNSKSGDIHFPIVSMEAFHSSSPNNRASLVLDASFLQ